jgi:hypothetical protein
VLRSLVTLGQQSGLGAWSPRLGCFPIWNNKTATTTTPGHQKQGPGSAAPPCPPPGATCYVQPPVTSGYTREGNKRPAVRRPYLSPNYHGHQGTKRPGVRRPYLVQRPPGQPKAWGPPPLPATRCLVLRSPGQQKARGPPPPLHSTEPPPPLSLSLSPT